MIACASLFIWTLVASFGFAMELKPVSDFSNWVGELYYGSSQSTFNPAFISSSGADLKVNIQGEDGSDIWTGLYESGSDGGIGMLATINVSDFSGNGQVGISDSLGKIGNDRIQVQVYLQQWDGVKSLKYRLRTKDLTTGSQKEILSGYFGSYSSDEWSIGQSVTVGMMRTGDDFWFYVQGQPGFVKWTSETTVEDLTWSPEIFSYVDSGSGNSVTADVTDVLLIKN